MDRPNIYFRERGSGPPLVLVHGVMVTGAMFEPVIGALARHHRLIIPDLRGSGESRRLPPPYSATQQAADISRLLDCLNIPSADVLGYSQGGAVVQQLALDDPGRVRRLIISNTYAYNMTTVREKLEGHIAPLIIRLLGLRRFASLVIAQGLKRVPADLARWVVDMIAGQERDLMIAAWKEAMTFDSRNRLRDIKCPTLIVAGADDDAVPMHHATTLHAGIEGSRLVVIEHADHALIWAQPERLVQVIETFLRDWGPGGPWPE